MTLDSYLSSTGKTAEDIRAEYAKKAEHDLSEKKGDLFAFGRPFISNTHLVSKLKHKKALTPADPTTFYTPGEKGYTDYPLE